jgi:molecular chaperone GrpE (heat shock protein)
MTDRKCPRLNKLPFLVGDAVLVVTAVLIWRQGMPALTLTHMALVAACVLAGAILAIIPIIIEYKAAVAFAQAETLASAVTRMEQLERIDAQIRTATGQWQTIQDESGKAANAAREVAEKMAAELTGFKQFMQRANDSERANLRLEVEKLRQAEQESVQVCVRMLDHVFALYQGGIRSGRPELIQQLGNFQNACREAARRVGLMPYVPGPGETFDPARHQLLEGDPKEAVGAQIREVVATGFTLQGKPARPALVRVEQAKPAETPAVPA